MDRYVGLDGHAEGLQEARRVRSAEAPVQRTPGPLVPGLPRMGDGIRDPEGLEVGVPSQVSQVVVPVDGRVSPAPTQGAPEPFHSQLCVAQLCRDPGLGV